MKSDISFQLENAAWPAFVVEAGGTIRHANTAAVSFFGPKLEGEGISLSALWAEPKETADQFLARWERLPSTTSPIRFHGKGGSVSTFATYICPIRNVQKRYLFQLIPGKPAQPPRANDLSALGVPEAGSPSSSADTVFVHKQKLDCALQLTRSVALDFNNVLTCILGHTSLLLTKAEPDHPWRPALLEVEKATDRAAEITHDLAMFSRQEKDAPTHASGNLNAVLRRVVETFQKTQPIGIQWALHLEAHLYTVKFDEAKVQQVFVKILENAAEAVGETGRITVTSRNLDISEPTQDLTAQLVPGPHVCIEFSDDGRGIAPEYIARVFEPFFSTKHGHRGLGLAWVYGIVTNHRGGVAVSSQPREKTSVRVYLPASKKIVTETALMAPTTGPRRTILLVDDEELLLTMGRTVLSSFGYEVLTANSGLRALELITASQKPIDLVITDLVMPQMSGHELIEQIQIRLPGIPILCISGYVRPGMGEENEAYLAKPFSIHELLGRIKQLLEPIDVE